MITKNTSGYNWWNRKKDDSCIIDKPSDTEELIKRINKIMSARHWIKRVEYLKHKRRDLIVLAPNQKPIQQAEITKVVQKYKLIVEIDFSEDKCSNKAGSANIGFPYNTVSECEVEQRDECERIGDDSDYCEGKRERFRDDCEGFKSAEECDKYWETPPGEPPICDENTPPGTVCRDEGDPDTCEDGFVDRGSGCVREDDGDEEDGEDVENPGIPPDEGEDNEFFDGGSDDGGSEDQQEGGNEDQEASSDGILCIE